MGIGFGSLIAADVTEFRVAFLQGDARKRYPGFALSAMKQALALETGL
jgi:hypothetical protein